LGGRARAAEAGGTNLIFQFSDAEDLQFDDNSFDLVVCCLVLSLCDQEAVTIEIERVLKPGGAVLILDYDALSRVDYLRSMHAVIEACVPEWRNLHHSFGVCVCVCVCEHGVCVCVCVCVLAHTHTQYTHTHTHTHTHTCMYMDMYVCIMRMCVCTYIRMYVCNIIFFYNITALTEDIIIRF
jgi:2-polyprenyl-3-methyl-5-hydroxy-6-metoxy-1,4-benzoquinol methylase